MKAKAVNDTGKGIGQSEQRVDIFEVVVMSEKKPFTFTAVSYVTDKASDAARCREELVLEQVRSGRGTDAFRLVRRTVFLPEEEQKKMDEKRMKQVGKALSKFRNRLKTL